MKAFIWVIDYSSSMSGFTIGDFYLDVQTDAVPFYYYHRAVYWPDWIQDELPTFQRQVTQMTSPKKPLKLTATARIQMGYPHEVNTDHKKDLYQRGIKRDAVSAKVTTTIPKLYRQDLQKLWLESNLITASTPTNSNFLRDVTVVDTESHQALVFCYVVSRKGHVLTAWSELKNRDGTWSCRAPKDFTKLLSLQTKPLNN